MLKYSPYEILLNRVRFPPPTAFFIRSLTTFNGFEAATATRKVSEKPPQKPEKSACEIKKDKLLKITLKKTIREIILPQKILVITALFLNFND
jgi:hypothetical protein